MLEITVASEPSAAIKPIRYFWDVDLGSLNEYDTTLVKPALLIADKVKLISFREDMRTLARADGIRNVRMPIRYTLAYAAFSLRSDSEELEILGLDSKVFADRQECEKLFDSKSFSQEEFLAFTERYGDQLMEYRVAYGKLLKWRHDSLEVPELSLAIDRNVLQQVGWLPDYEYIEQELNWMDRNVEVFDLAVASLVDKLATSSTPLIDPGTQSLISTVLGGKTVKKASKKKKLSDLDQFAPVASALVAQIPGLSDLSVAEILDLRDDLSDYLPAFRSAIIDLSRDISQDSTNDSVKLAQRVEYAWHKEINVILQDIRHQAMQARYSTQILNSLTKNKGSLTSTASSLVLAAGAMVAGLAALIPAAAAAAYPFLHALNEKKKVEQELQKNKLFFLYAVDKRISKRK